MEFIKVRTKDNQIKYISSRNIISFKEVELTSEEAKTEFGENPRALVIDLTGNNRVEAFGTGEEIGSLISILCGTEIEKDSSSFKQKLNYLDSKTETTEDQVQEIFQQIDDLPEIRDSIKTILDKIESLENPQVAV